MRVRTAIGITAAFLSAKAALTVAALAAWTAIPERRWPIGVSHIELGSLAEWLAAAGSFGAALAALYIAGRETRNRRREREEADLSQARLVRHEFERHPHAQDFILRIHNYGA